MKAKDAQVFTRPLSAEITVPDPDNVPVSTYSEVGGMIEFRSDAPNYPHFLIEWTENNPEDDQLRRTFLGTHESPVLIQSNRVGDFTYMVTYLTDEAHQHWMRHYASASGAERKSSDSDANPDPPPFPPPPPPRLGPFYHESVPCKHCDP